MQRSFRSPVHRRAAAHRQALLYQQLVAGFPTVRNSGVRSTAVTAATVEAARAGRASAAAVDFRRLWGRWLRTPATAHGRQQQRCADRQESQRHRLDGRVSPSSHGFLTQLSSVENKIRSASSEA